MSVIIGNYTYEVYDLGYEPSYNRLQSTRRVITGAVDRTDTEITERIYTLSLYCNRTQKNQILTDLANVGTVTFEDEELVSLEAYFISPVRVQEINPKGFNDCNEFVVSFQLMTDDSYGFACVFDRARFDQCFFS